MKSPVAHGATFRCKADPYHIWVVISDPAIAGETVLIVNFTSFGEFTVDDACILEKSDYSLLDWTTTVAYSRRHSGAASGLIKLVESGAFRPIDPVPPATLAKIVAGARKSPELSKADRSLLPN